MKLTKYIFLLFLSISCFLSSCMKDRENLYNGPSVVEFSPITGSVKKGTTAAPGSAVVAVQLVGPQSSSANDIGYVVSGTGANGTDYTISGTPNKVTIPANASSANITITALPATFPTTGSKTVILTLTGGTDLPPSANYKTYTLTITQ